MPRLTFGSGAFPSLGFVGGADPAGAASPARFLSLPFQLPSGGYCSMTTHGVLSECSMSVQRGFLECWWSGQPGGVRPVNLLVVTPGWKIPIAGAVDLV